LELAALIPTLASTHMPDNYGLKRATRKELSTGNMKVKLG
jgi:hypothetical protein